MFDSRDAVLPPPRSLWLDGTEEIVSTEFPEADRADTVVVGAGITGLTSAVLLARAGQNVIVLEARYPGAAATGNTSAKVSLLQGSVLSGIRDHTSAKVTKAYVDGNRMGASWLLDYLETAGIPVEIRTAHSYAVSPAGYKRLAAEYTAALDAGLKARWGEQLDLPFPTTAAISLDGQAQVNPVEVLRSLAETFRALGGRIVLHSRVRAVEAAKPVRVITDRGSIEANQVILATGTPILDRGLYFAKTQALRSYVTAYTVPSGEPELPSGMYLSVDDQPRSLRTALLNGTRYLLVGGNGHPVGRAQSTEALVTDLTNWTTRYFPGAIRTHWWAAQDYRSANHIPFVGWLPRGHGRIFLATGFNKWGLTNGVAAALSLTADLTGARLSWAQVLHHRVTRPVDIATGVGYGAEVAAYLTKDWVDAELSGVAVPTRPPPTNPTTLSGGAEEQLAGPSPAIARHTTDRGEIGVAAFKPTATSTVSGVTCTLSAVCTHLGGIVHWNDAERSWDCPLHGSRFGSDGTVLEGPATRDLKKLS